MAVSQRSAQMQEWGMKELNVYDGEWGYADENANANDGR